MDGHFPPLVELLLTSGRTVALLLNDKLAVRVAHNAPLLTEWRGHNEPLAGSLRALLEELLPLPRARDVLAAIERAAGSVDGHGIDLGDATLRTPRGGGPDRYVAMALHRLPEPADIPLLLLLRDVTSIAGLQQTLAQTQGALDAAMTALRSAPQALRLFLSAATASVAALRATMKLPARDQEAVHAKLARLQEGAEQLRTEAAGPGIDAVVDACRVFAEQVQVLRQQPEVSGDALLPLAPLLDRIAAGVDATARIEEQRYASPAKTREAAMRAAQPDADPAHHAPDDWAHAAERRWSSFLRQRGEELGTLVKLQVENAHQVPAGLRRGVDDMLQHLLRNAIEHGIETPEERLAAEKPAAGQIGVKFADHGAAGLTLVVRDDGRGFDVERIGRAAVKSGLVSEESLLEREPGEVVGLIFKPMFSTENLDGEAGRGRGMNYLRRAVARLGGQISVATKPGRYTQFIIQLPPRADAAADKAASPEPA